MKKISLVVLFVLTHISFSQYVPEWVQLHTQSQMAMTINSLMDGTGNMIAVNDYFNGSNYDVVTTKYSATGSLIWTRTFSSIGLVDLDFEENTAAGESNGLTAETTIPRSEFIEGENIFISISIVNNSSKRDSIKLLGPSGLAKGLIVVDSDNKVSSFKGLDPSTWRSPYFTLEPGERKQYTIELLYYYGNRVNEVMVLGNINELNPDTYRVQFLGNEMIYGKEFSSNSINIKVNQATGDDLTELSELREIYKLPPTKDQLLLYRKFVHKYENSSYMEQAFYYSLGVPLITKTMDLEELIHECKWFIDKKPNSEYLSTVVPECAIMIKDKFGSNALETFLNEIVSKHPDTKASENAINHSNKIKNK